jgi:transposase
MDADGPIVQGSVSGGRRYRTTEEKRRIVEQTLSSGLSVASVAREHGINANQVFYWRKLYRAGQLEIEGSAEQQVRLLPVSVSDGEPAETEPEAATSPAHGVTINIEFPGRTLVSLEGAIDADIVRAVVESLRG